MGKLRSRDIKSLTQGQEQSPSPNFKHRALHQIYLLPLYTFQKCPEFQNTPLSIPNEGLGVLKTILTASLEL